jgi:hypothetical protein
MSKQGTTTGRVWINNSTDDKLICACDLQVNLENGWFKGRRPESCEKNRVSSKIKGSYKTVWVHCQSTKERKQIPIALLDGYLNTGWSKGMGSVKDKSITLDAFISKAVSVHGDKFDYSKTILNHLEDRVTIVCKEHGEFTQKAAVHLSGRGCIGCRNDSFKTRYAYDNQTFISKANELFGNRYDYSETDYQGARSNVIIKCPRHGKFEKLAFTHLQGQGCPRCINRNGASKGQKEIALFLTSVTDGLEEDARIFKNPKSSVDVYCPGKRLAIEFNGSYWHRDEIRGKNFHVSRLNECLESSISLIQINDHEWYEKPEVVKSMLLHRLGITPIKVHARACDIRIVSSKDTRDFMELNHIQGGHVTSSVNLGLYLADELVSMMTFGKPRMNKGYEWELIRFCNRTYTRVTGGAQKLFRHFIKTSNPGSIITYANRRYSTGNLYQQLGMVHSHTTEPGYFYTNGRDHGSRFKYQKHKLKRMFPAVYDENLTETEIMKSAGYLRVFDCGNLVYSWHKSVN